MEIKIGVPIEKRVEFANWAYPHFKHVIGKTIFDLVINDSVDFRKSAYIIQDDTLLGLYLLGPTQIYNPIFSKLLGIEGVLLAVDESIRGMGWGNKLKDYPKTLNVDYIWGYQAAGLNNIEYWLKRRVLVNKENNCYVTCEIFADDVIFINKKLMRRFDKQKNIAAANLLSEQRHLTDRDSVTEDWKTNVAAGLATIGGVAGANAQTNKPMAPQQGKEIQYSPSEKPTSNMANPYGTKDDSTIHPRTIPIVGIQSGVTDGKSGQSAVYVYHNHLPSDPNFNVKRDRETVYTKNLSDLYKTQEYQEYKRSLNK